MAEHDEHSSFIKTPQQLIVIVFLAFVVPIVGIVLTVQLVMSRPPVDPAALSQAAVAARLKPVAGDAVVAAAGAGGSVARSGEEVSNTVCAACHNTGVQGAPKIGDKASWAPYIKEGMNRLLASAIKGVTVKGVLLMPPRGGGADLSDAEVASAIVYMANKSGGSLKEPAPKPAATKK